MNGPISWATGWWISAFAFVTNLSPPRGEASAPSREPAGTCWRPCAVPANTDDPDRLDGLVGALASLPYECCRWPTLDWSLGRLNLGSGWSGVRSRSQAGPLSRACRRGARERRRCHRFGWTACPEVRQAGRHEHSCHPVADRPRFGRSGLAAGRIADHRDRESGLVRGCFLWRPN